PKKYRFGPLFPRRSLCQAAGVKSASAEIAALQAAGDESLDAGIAHRAAPRGDDSIIAGLFRRRAKRVKDYLAFRLRNKEDAEDATQEVFVKLWRREGMGALREEANAYMYSTALSVATDAERQRTSQARERFIELELEEIAQAAPSQEEKLHWRQAMQHFVYCVK